MTRINRETLTTVRNTIATMEAEGFSRRDIVTRLVRDGFKSATGKKITPAFVSAQLYRIRHTKGFNTTTGRITTTGKTFRTTAELLGSVTVPTRTGRTPRTTSPNGVEIGFNLINNVLATPFTAEHKINILSAIFNN